MSILVDDSLCIGCGICVDNCPSVFTMNSDGKAEAIKQTCDSCNLEEIADMCPVQAIEVSI